MNRQVQTLHGPITITTEVSDTAARLLARWPLGFSAESPPARFVYLASQRQMAVALKLQQVEVEYDVGNVNLTELRDYLFEASARLAGIGADPVLLGCLYARQRDNDRWETGAALFAGAMQSQEVDPQTVLGSVLRMDALPGLLLKATRGAAPHPTRFDREMPKFIDFNPAYVSDLHHIVPVTLVADNTLFFLAAQLDDDDPGLAWAVQAGLRHLVHYPVGAGWDPAGA
jgi:hypothetical protein